MWIWIAVSISCFAPSGLAQPQEGGFLVCQSEWIEGSKVTLHFFIDRSLFPSSCAITPDNQPYFRKSTTASGNPVTNCTVPDITSSCGSFTSGQLGCGCVAQNGTHYIMEYSFTAHPDYDGWWSVDAQCSDMFANPALFFTKEKCDDKKVKASTTTVSPSTTGQPATSDGLTDSEKGGIAVGCLAGVSVLLLLILTLVKCKGEELVGLDDEQIKRIDHYVQLLQANKPALRKIEKKRGFGCCDMPTKLRVDGFHSLNEAGELRDVQKQLRIAISIRLFFLCRRSMETVKQEVRDFLRENVTPFKVRIVKDPGNIARQKLESIAAKTETKILPPAENRKGEMVIQIEGRDDRAVDDAKKEVMKLIQSSGSANGGDGP